jgi:hypothetical protein
LITIPNTGAGLTELPVFALRASTWQADHRLPVIRCPFPRILVFWPLLLPGRHLINRAGKTDKGASPAGPHTFGLDGLASAGDWIFRTAASRRPRVISKQLLDLPDRKNTRLLEGVNSTQLHACDLGVVKVDIAVLFAVTNVAQEAPTLMAKRFEVVGPRE